ncbi:MAG: WXG100 family type VII secretion target [Firmicutes bacterium]|nr:WXG100 family type VII secretion target [Bacillota bacterium]
MTLRVEPAQVRASAEKINGISDRMRQVMQEIQQQVDRLPQDQWDSNSGRDFAQRYQEIRKSCENALNVMRIRTTNLNNAAQEYDTTEATQQQTVQNLSAANVFN